MNKRGLSRRDFLKRQTIFGFGAATAGGWLIAGCEPDRENHRLEEAAEERPETIRQIGPWSLEELRDRYREEFFGRFLPNMNRYAVDHEYGGVMCNLDVRTGELANREKRSWFVGRGLWLYSWLYNNLDPDPDWLEIARRSKDLILKVQPEGDDFWPRSFDRRGEELSDPGDIYGSLFAAEGLFEYAIASGEEEYWTRAKQIIFHCLDRYDDPGYEFRVGYLPGGPEIEGPRVLGHWMIFLSLCTQMLRHRDDEDLEALADRCVEAILEHHVNPAYRLTNEIINHDLSIPDNAYGQLCVIGHGLETMAFVMFEAERRGDRQMFETARREFKRHVDIAHDPVYEGYFHTLRHVDDYTWTTSKALWAQEEVLLGTLFLLEHTGDPWAERHFEQTYTYIYDRFIQDDHVFWHSGGDRSMDDPNTGLLEHYHHARQWMYGIRALDRMIERDGEISGRFS